MRAADQHGLGLSDRAVSGEQAEALVEAHHRHSGVLLSGSQGGRHLSDHLRHGPPHPTPAALDAGSRPSPPGATEGSSGPIGASAC